MRGTLVLAVFAAGTLGDKTLGFPKTSYGVSVLMPHSEGQRYNRREVTGASHEVTRKDEETSTCTPVSDEHYDRLDALYCNEEYMRAVREDIDKSNCVNANYIPEGNEDTDSCAIIDERTTVNINIFERVNINFCSEECSCKQAGYLFCKYIGEEAVSIDRECGVPSAVVGVGRCSFNNNNFCSFEVAYPSSNFPIVYNECFLKSNVNNESCSDQCKEALDNFKDAHGCCVSYYFDYSFSHILNNSGNEMLSASLFSTCGIEIPEVCNSFSPPESFLDCAHDDIDDKDGELYAIYILSIDKCQLVSQLSTTQLP